MKDRVVILGAYALPKPGNNKIDKNFKQLAIEACFGAIEDAGISPLSIDGASFAYFGEGEIGYGGIGPTLVDALGLAPIHAYVNSANCASAHVAFLNACDMVLSKRYKYVLACGFDKHTDLISLENYMISSDSMYDYSLGISHIDYFLLSAAEYFRQYQIAPEIQRASMVKFGRMMRENAFYHPIASMYQIPVPTSEEIENMLFWGNVLSAGEGASAVVMTLESNLRDTKYPNVYVAGTGHVSTSQYAAHRYHADLLHAGENMPCRSNFAEALPLELACAKAYEEAGIMPGDVGILGVYDQAVNHFLSIEAAGICEKGQAPRFIIEGKGDIDGVCSINTDGGNIARGHAGGGASMYQIVEICKQLQNRAEGRQADTGKNYGMSTVIGGFYSTAAAVILSKI